jgi:hypothetical protein
MTWKTIRLELARSEAFPEGSPSRGYQLHLPLRPDGIIDQAAFAAARQRAIAFRFWPDERDLNGHVLRTAKGWAISYAPGEDDEQGVFHLETHPLKPGNYLTITGSDGATWPFRVASVEPLA